MSTVNSVPVGPPDVHMRIANETDLTSAIAVVDWSMIVCAFSASPPEQPETAAAAEATRTRASKRRMSHESVPPAPRAIPEGASQAYEEKAAPGFLPRRPAAA